MYGPRIWNMTLYKANVNSRKQAGRCPIYSTLLIGLLLSMNFIYTLFKKKILIQERSIQTCFFLTHFYLFILNLILK